MIIIFVILILVVGTEAQTVVCRSPARRPDDPDRSVEELVRLGWTKRKANKVLKMYSKWGSDDVSRDIQRRTLNGFISLREAQRIATGLRT